MLANVSQKGFTFRRCLGALAVFLAVTLPVAARPSSAVQDHAHVLSPDTVTKIQQIDDEIFRATGKDLLVVTESSISGSPQSESDNIFRREQLNGMLILVVPGKKELGIVPGKATQAIFPKSRLTEIRQSMLPHFRNKDIDKGVLEGAQGVRTTFLASAPAAQAAQTQPPVQSAPPRAYSQPVRSSSSGFGSFFFVGFLIMLIGFFVVVAIARSIFGGGSRRETYVEHHDSYGGGGGGGSLLGSFAAGVGGAVVGNALYDSFRHRNDDDYRGGGSDGGGDYGDGGGGSSQPAWTQSDEGSAGSGDFGSYSDSGGGGGSDWGGGGSDSGSGDSDWG